MSTPTLEYEAIRNVIARYCIALDTQDWELLRKVFTPDVVAKYPLPGGDLEGVEALMAKIQSRLTPITSQHNLGTQMIEISKDGNSAETTTYFTGIHFGKGKWAGKNVAAYGKYVDRLVCDQTKGGEIPGSTGVWRIARRVTMFMGRVGEEGVMTGEDG